MRLLRWQISSATPIDVLAGESHEPTTWMITCTKHFSIPLNITDSGHTHSTKSISKRRPRSINQSTEVLANESHCALPTSIVHPYHGSSQPSTNHQPPIARLYHSEFLEHYRNQRNRTGRPHIRILHDLWRNQLRRRLNQDLVSQLWDGAVKGRGACHCLESIVPAWQRGG